MTDAGAVRHLHRSLSLMSRTRGCSWDVAGPVLDVVRSVASLCEGKGHRGRPRALKDDIRKGVVAGYMIVTCVFAPRRGYTRNDPCLLARTITMRLTYSS